MSLINGLDSNREYYIKNLKCDNIKSTVASNTDQKRGELSSNGWTLIKSYDALQVANPAADVVLITSGDIFSKYNKFRVEIIASGNLATGIYAIAQLEDTTGVLTSNYNASVTIWNSNATATSATLAYGNPIGTASNFNLGGNLTSASAAGVLIIEADFYIQIKSDDNAIIYCSSSNTFLKAGAVSVVNKLYGSKQITGKIIKNLTVTALQSFFNGDTEISAKLWAM